MAYIIFVKAMDEGETMKRYLAFMLLFSAFGLNAQTIREGIHRTMHGEVVKGPIEAGEGAVLDAEDVVAYSVDHERHKGELASRKERQEKRKKAEQKDKKQKAEAKKKPAKKKITQKKHYEKN